MSGIDQVPDGTRDGYWRRVAAQQLVVSGTAIDTDTGELVALTAKSRAVEDRLHEIYGLVRSAQDAVRATTALAAGTGADAQTQCGFAKGSLLTAAREAGDLAEALELARQEYERAEGEVRQGSAFTLPRSLTGAARPVPWLLGLDVLPWALPRLAAIAAGNMGLAAERGQLTPTGAGMGYFLQEMSWTATGGPLLDWVVPGFEDVNRSVLLASGLSWTTGLLLGTGTGVAIQRVYPTPQVVNGRLRVPVTRAAAGTADMAVGLGVPRISDALPEGTVRLDRVTDTEGNASWQVYVPGTETSWDDPRPATVPFVPRALGVGLAMTPLAGLAPLARNAPAPRLVPGVLPGAPALAGPVLQQAGDRLAGAIRNPNPLDWNSNLRLYTGQEAASQNGVVEALRAAGAQPDEPVLLTGHSQGGMIVMNMANDPAVRADFDIRSAVTFGGPVGQLPTPEGVAVLHVEHEEDVVGNLANEPNPVAGNRVNVIRSLSGSPLAADGEVNHIGESHDLPAFARTGVLIDASADPAIESWRAQSAEVLATGEVTTETIYYQIRRDE
ncbi:hypothetical protein LQF12_15530 [Ruania suaedae]|uniref:hypothetical protein n=1 Tax=Ruania suaedae TaxID=2897774 RepID=UPI001E65BB74|nr:hypothetical protein [Ruania suaedae]UFU02875.1 hypothetical protein LQF12_15530 [Ruania suaedae]